MRKSCFITFVISCLFILSLTSCGNFVSKNTGSIVIALPGAGGARESNPTVPSESDIKNAEYTIFLYHDNSSRTVKAASGSIITIDNLTAGDYELKAVAHAGSGYVESNSASVSVVLGETASAELTFDNIVERFHSENGVIFTICRQFYDNEVSADDYECFLIGPKGIMIKPNLDISLPFGKEYWQGCWPYAASGDDFYLGGNFCTNSSFSCTWHDTSSSPVSCRFTGSNTAPYQISDLGDVDRYKNVAPQVEVTDGTRIMSWIPAGDISLPGDMWCKIEIWSGEKTEHGAFVSGTHFKCNGNEYQKLLSGSLTFNDMVLYDGKNASWLNSQLGDGPWFIRCNLFSKPDGDGSLYCIHLPIVDSNVAN